MGLEPTEATWKDAMLPFTSCSQFSRQLPRLTVLLTTSNCFTCQLQEIQTTSLITPFISGSDYKEI